MGDFIDGMAIVVRVATPNSLAFQLRRGEIGLSVFDPNSVEPPLTEAEILEAFRENSYLEVRSRSDVAALGLLVEFSEGTTDLPERLRLAHHEIRSGPSMTRNEFKTALKGLE